MTPVITDEMVKAATKAADEAKKEFQFANTTIPALTAAYPLIRAAVLEEAAYAIEAIPSTAKRFSNYESDFDEGVDAGVKKAWEEIRNMAKEG